MVSDVYKAWATGDRDTDFERLFQSKAKEYCGHRYTGELDNRYSNEDVNTFKIHYCPDKKDTRNYYLPAWDTMMI